MTDREFLDALRVGNREAERDFYLQHKSQCIGYAKNELFWKTKEGQTLRCSAEDAEELYNDACTLFIQNVRKGRIDRLEVKRSTYLIKTMQYAWFNKARARTSAINAAPVTDLSATVKESMRVNVHRAISQLDEKCREMMTYRYILGWEDYDDIAKVTGKNNGDVVRNLISRCRKRFRAQYEKVRNLKGT